MSILSLRRIGVTAIVCLTTWTSCAIASLTIDLRVNQIDGLPTCDTKTAAVSVGSVVSVDVYAIVRGNNATSVSDGFQSLQGSFIAKKSPNSSDGIRGHFIPTGNEILDATGNPTGQRYFAVSPFADNSTTNGKQQDLTPKDGNLDYGNEPTDQTGIVDFLAVRAKALQQTGGIVIPEGQDGHAGRMFKIATFDWKVDSLNNFPTELNYTPRTFTNGNITNTSALWLEDSPTGAKDGFTGKLLVDAPIQVVALDGPPAVCPEPSVAVLGMIGIIALGKRPR